MTPADHRLHVLPRAFENSFHPPVGKVSDPPVDAPRSRPIPSLYSKEDALHSSGDEDMRADCWVQTTCGSTPTAEAAPTLRALR